jgi:hypothetical protein
MAVFKGFVEGPVTRNEWRFDDGKIFTNLLQVVHAWEAVGARPVVFTAFNDSYPGGISATTIVNVAIAPTAYVDIASVTPAPPFASWQTAATTIQEAVDVGSIAGRVVWVTNGIYSTGGVAIEGLMTNRVALKDGVTVRSVNGPDVTLITGSPALTGGPGDGALRCAYLSDGSVLSGFTLTNGNTRSAGHTSREQGGGGAWSTSRGVLTNCVLVGNQAARDGGGVNGGRLYRCVLTGNLAYDDGGGADDSVLFDCILTNNEAINGGGAADESTLERCTIVNNRAQLDGGGTDDSTLRDCLLRGNIATSGPAAAADGYFYGCTIVHHPSPNYPFVVLDAFIYNSIVYHNERTNQHDSVMFYHSCTTPAPPGGFGNITNAPAFVNMNSGNFRLLPGFPGIDAGLDLTGADARDLDGNRRPVDGNGDGISRFDMGAFEFTPPRFITARRTNATVIVSWTPAPGFRLERAAALPAIPWTDVSITNGQTAIEWPMGSGNEFFRLIHP